MTNEPQYDVALVGGGLAGLAAAILLRKQGHRVILIEKEHYPFHKVCGEYISLESRNFLMQLGLPLEEMKLPLISQLLLTAPGGRSFQTPLDLGGFGLSRYRLDQELANLAKRAGVDLLEGTKVQDIEFEEDQFNILTQSRSRTPLHIKAKVCCAAYGKRSNLDIKWQRDVNNRKKSLENYVGVKYHVRTKWDERMIGLHNFQQGYCGISKIEDDLYCLCYLTTAANLKKSENSIPQMEERILYRNPHLKNIFRESEFCSGFPVTISQISFRKKSQVEEHVLMLGDAAGMITPLCGNGMSMALHSALLATNLVHPFLDGHINRQAMEEGYAAAWKKNFHARLQTGRLIQRFFGSSGLSNAFVGLFKTFPFLAGPVVKMTHGKPF